MILFIHKSVFVNVPQNYKKGNTMLFENVFFATLLNIKILLNYVSFFQAKVENLDSFRHDTKKKNFCLETYRLRLDLGKR